MICTSLHDPLSLFSRSVHCTPQRCRTKHTPVAVVAATAPCKLVCCWSNVRRHATTSIHTSMRCKLYDSLTRAAVIHVHLADSRCARPVLLTEKLLELHLLHCALHVPRVRRGHGLQRNFVLAANLDRPNLVSGTRQVVRGCP